MIAQKRLAGGRLAHAMRWIGAAQRVVDLPPQRLLTRKAFGKELARHQALQFMLADCAMDLYSSRLMVLHTAWKVENGLPHRQEVAMTKTYVSEAFGRIADRAVQIFGAAGFALDLPIGRIYADARAARIYDGAVRGAPDGDRARVPEARHAGRGAGEGLRGPDVSTTHQIAPDDIVRRATTSAGREPLVVVEPLLGVPRRARPRRGRAGVRAGRRGPLQRHLRRRRGDARFVLRRPPRGPLPPSAHDMLREARVLSALHGHARVPGCSRSATTSR